MEKCNRCGKEYPPESLRDLEEEKRICIKCEIGGGIIIWNPKDIFDWKNIDATRFEELCLHLLKHEVSPMVTTHGLVKDGGLDGYFEGQYENTEGKWGFEVKTSSFGRGLEERRRTIKNEIKKHLRKPVVAGLDYLIYLVNLDLTKLNKDSIEVFAQEYTEAKIIFWEKKDIESLLIKFPYLISLFFSRYRRIFIEPEQFIDIYSNEEWVCKTFLGREEEKQSSVDFLETSESILTIYGPRGIGKTHLSVEISKTILNTDNSWNIYFLLSESESFEEHLAEIALDKNLLIIIDDAEYFTQLKRFIKILNDFQRPTPYRSKIILLADINQKNRIEYELRNFNLGKTEITLSPLNQEEFVTVLRENYSIQQDQRLYSYWTRAKGVPGVIPLLTKLDTYEEAEDIGKSYYKIVNQFTNTLDEKEKRLLTLIALVEPYSIYDSALTKSISEIIDSDILWVESSISKMLKQGLIRVLLSKIRMNLPILSNALLWSCLVIDGKEISQAWRKITFDFLLVKPKEVLRNLLPVEEEIKKSLNSSLLAEFYDILEQMAETRDSLEQFKILSYLKDLAYHNPSFTLRIIKQIVSDLSTISDNQIKESDINQDIIISDILDILQEILYHLIHSEECLEILNSLYFESSDYLAKRVKDLVETQFGYSLRKPLIYQKAALNWLINKDILLNSLKEADFYFGLLTSAMRSEFHDVQLSPEDRNKIVIRRGFVPKNDGVVEIRQMALKKLITLILESDNDSIVRSGLKKIKEIFYDNFRSSGEGKTDFPTTDEITLVLEDLLKSISETSSISILREIKTILEVIVKIDNKWESEIMGIAQRLSQNKDLQFLNHLKEMKFDYISLGETEWVEKLEVIEKFSVLEFTDFLIRFSKSDEAKYMDMVFQSFFFNLGKFKRIFSKTLLDILIEKRNEINAGLIGLFLASFRVYDTTKYENILELLVSTKCSHDDEILLHSFGIRVKEGESEHLALKYLLRIKDSVSSEFHKKMIRIAELWWNFDPDEWFKLVSTLDYGIDANKAQFLETIWRLESVSPWDDKHVKFLKGLIADLKTKSLSSRTALFQELDFALSALVKYDWKFITEFLLKRIQYLKKIRNPNFLTKIGLKLGLIKTLDRDFDPIPDFFHYFDSLEKIDEKKDNIKFVLNFIRDNISDTFTILHISKLVQRIITGTTSLHSNLGSTGKDHLINFSNNLHIENLWIIPHFMTWMNFDENILAVYNHMYSFSKGDKRLRSEIIASFVTSTGGSHELNRKKSIIDNYEYDQDPYKHELKEILLKDIARSLKNEREYEEEDW